MGDSTDAASERALDSSLIGGLAWTGAARLLAQVLSWAATLLVARLLTESDYGIVGMATVYLGIVQLINEFGLGAAVIRDSALDEAQCADLGGVSVALGFFFFALSILLAHPLAVFFHEPAVWLVVVVLSSTFAITGLRVLPSALLARDRNFQRLARIDWLEAVIQTIATLALAIAGFRYWSLVIGSIVGALVSTTLTIMARPHRLAWPSSLRPVVEPLSVGWHVTASRIGWYVYSNADFAVVGRILGRAALGAYTFAWQIASIPVDKTSGIMGRVTLPIFSRVQDDKPALRRYVKALTEGLALLTFPIAFGLALVTDEFVRFLLGDHWAGAIGPLRFLALYAGFRSVMTLFPHILIAIGHTRRNMWLAIALAVIMPLAFFGATRWGTTGVAVAWLAVYPVVAVPFLVLPTLRAIGMSPGEYFAALWPAILGTLVMTAAVLGAGNLVPEAWGVGARFFVKVGAGAVAYGATVWTTNRARLMAFLQLVRAPA